MVEWYCRLDWQVAPDARLDRADGRRLEEALAGVAKADGISCHYGQGDEGYALASTQLMVEGTDVAGVLGATVPVVEKTLGVTVTGVEVLTADEYELRHIDRWHEDRELVGYAQIARILGVSRQRARQVAQTAEGFPQVAVMVVSGPQYDRAEVETWAATRERRPGRPRKAQSSGM